MNKLPIETNLLKKLNSYISLRNVGYTTGYSVYSLFDKWISSFLAYHDDIYMVCQNGVIRNLQYNDRLRESIDVFARDNPIPKRVSLLTTQIANSLNTNVLPKTNSYEDINSAIYTNRLLNAILDEYDFEDVRDIVITNLIIYGVSGMLFSYSEQDDLVFKAIPPTNFVVSPTLQSPRKMKEVFILHLLPADYIEARWGYKSNQTTNISFPMLESYLGLEGIQVIEYFSPDRHLFMLANGSVLQDDTNEYGVIPFSFGRIFPRTDNSLGQPPVDLARSDFLWSSILKSILLTNALKYGFIVLAPEGTFKNEDIRIHSGGVLKYNITGTQPPQFVNTHTLSPDMMTLLSEFRERAQEVMAISPVEAGNISPYQSGKAIEQITNTMNEEKYHYTKSASSLFKDFFRKFTKFILEDPLHIFEDKEEFLLEGEGLVRYDKSMIKYSDIEISLFPVTKNDLFMVLFRHTLARLENKAEDKEASLMLNNLISSLDIDFLNLENKNDLAVARYENNLLLSMKDKFKDDILDEKQSAEYISIISKVQPQFYQDHNAHIQAHKEIVNSPSFYELPPFVQVAFVQHINRHQELMGGVFTNPEVQSFLQKNIIGQGGGSTPQPTGGLPTGAPPENIQGGM